ncbi:DUF6266 family protein [Mangrovimonas xylaniphaga]|uniref:DUF6266 family protein n=1 Tax=Mangrovimonas xylaniphaga TaxID=1645915 RepID=UPI0006B53EB4|nr:DUF6266 family protein [Mangrovimonas xylaniphaga]
MAKLDKGILGGFSGKVGNVVGVRWRGQDIMRSLPSRGHYVPSNAQLEQREKFGLVMKFLTPIQGLLNAYFGKRQSDKSPFNLAVSYHLKEAVEPVDEGFEMDYLKILISKGDLRGMDTPQVQALANQQLALSWEDNSGQGNASASDACIAVIYSPEGQFFQIFEGVALRGDGGVTLNLPAYFTGFEVYVWASFVTANQQEAATSSYLGSVTVT